MKRIRHRIEYGGVRLAMWMAGTLPLALTRRFGAAVGRLGWATRVRRAVILDNIRRALGVDEREAARIGRSSFENLGRSLMEYAAQRRLRHEQIRSMVTMDGLERLDEAMAHGRGAVFFTGHQGNWELLGVSLAAYGYPVDFLVGEQTNHMVDDVMNDLRRQQGIGIITRDVALRKVLRALGQNRIVALLGDQDAHAEGVFVDFCGRPASTVRGPAVFAIKQRCPIICGFIRRTPEGGHHAEIEELVWPNPDLDRDHAVHDLTQRCTRLLEARVRHVPEEYFWGHRRWKTRPPS